MKEILNQVVQAEKVAQANVIRRREETAATRSLLNTAKLMEDNPLLLRLKELEALEKVVDKVERLTVFGGLDGVLKDTVRGGINARSGQQSLIVVNSIIATQGGAYARLRAREDYAPPLSNASLFRRDCNTCLYCGETFHVRDLSRDHVRPIVQGGVDHWNNVVTACKPCNHHKGGKTPEQSGMQLLAIPFTPNHAEYVLSLIHI